MKVEYELNNDEIERAKHKAKDNVLAKILPGSAVAIFVTSTS